MEGLASPSKTRADNSNDMAKAIEGNGERNRYGISNGEGNGNWTVDGNIRSDEAKIICIILTTATNRIILLLIKKMYEQTTTTMMKIALK